MNPQTTIEEDQTEIQMDRIYNQLCVFSINNDLHEGPAVVDDYIYVMCRYVTYRAKWPWPEPHNNLMPRHRLIELTKKYFEYFSRSECVNPWPSLEEIDETDITKCSECGNTRITVEHDLDENLKPIDLKVECWCVSRPVMVNDYVISRDIATYIMKIPNVKHSAVKIINPDPERVHCCNQDREIVFFCGEEIEGFFIQKTGELAEKYLSDLARKIRSEIEENKTRQPEQACNAK